jgi:hypothetical protein
MSLQERTKTKKPAPLIFAWQRAVRDSDLTFSCKGFALILSTWANADGTSCFPSITLIADLGCSRATVYRHLAALEAGGWLDVSHGGGRLENGSYVHNTYALRLPQGYSPETERSQERATTNP